MSDPAYILFWDTSLVGDEGVTAALVPFPGSADIAGWKVLDPVPVPDRIYFEANVRTVRRVDYPDNDANWPIMSERMRSVLLPQASKHRAIPVTFLDDTVDPGARFDGDIPRKGVAIEGFAAIQILDCIDAMDMEQSRFTPDEGEPHVARDISKLVFKSVKLPRLFRLTSYSNPLFVSAEGRTALESASIKGVKYYPLARLAFM